MRSVFVEEFLFFLSLFILHSTILKPDFNLSFVESEHLGDLGPSGLVQVLVGVEFLLEFSQLMVGKVGSIGAIAFFQKFSLLRD